MRRIFMVIFSLFSLNLWGQVAPVPGQTLIFNFDNVQGGADFANPYITYIWGALYC